MPQFEAIGVQYPLVALPFSQADFAISQTDTALIAGSTATTYTALADGWVVGFAVSLSAAVSAGTLSIDVSIGGTAQTIDYSIATASTTEYTKTYRAGTYPFSAGDTLSVTYTSDGSLSPTTIDGTVTLYVVYDRTVF